MSLRFVTVTAPVLAVIIWASSTMADPITPRIDQATFHSFEQIMSSSDARTLQYALAFALGISPQSRRIDGSWDYRGELWTKAETNAIDANCSAIRLEGFFKTGPQGHILVLGVYCRSNLAAEWSTQSQQIVHLPGMPDEISPAKAQ